MSKLKQLKKQGMKQWSNHGNSSWSLSFRGSWFVRLGMLEKVADEAFFFRITLSATQSVRPSRHPSLFVKKIVHLLVGDRILAGDTLYPVLCRVYFSRPSTKISQISSVLLSTVRTMEVNRFSDEDAPIRSIYACFFDFLQVYQLLSETVISEQSNSRKLRRDCLLGGWVPNDPYWGHNLHPHRNVLGKTISELKGN
jgi:hypothetical protein